MKNVKLSHYLRLVFIKLKIVEANQVLASGMIPEYSSMMNEVMLASNRENLIVHYILEKELGSCKVSGIGRENETWKSVKFSKTNQPFHPPQPNPKKDI